MRDSISTNSLHCVLDASSFQGLICIGLTGSVQSPRSAHH